ADRNPRLWVRGADARALLEHDVRADAHVLGVAHQLDIAVDVDAFAKMVDAARDPPAPQRMAKRERRIFAHAALGRPGNGRPLVHQAFALRSTRCTADDSLRRSIASCQSSIDGRIMA